MLFRSSRKVYINTLNAELNPICHLLELLGAHHILHVSRIRVKQMFVVDDENIIDIPKIIRTYCLIIIFIMLLFLSCCNYISGKNAEEGEPIVKPMFCKYNLISYTK